MVCPTSFARVTGAQHVDSTLLEGAVLHPGGVRGAAGHGCVSITGARSVIHGDNMSHIPVSIIVSALS
jgi:hypothetical protein